MPTSLLRQDAPPCITAHQTRHPQPQACYGKIINPGRFGDPVTTESDQTIPSGTQTHRLSAEEGPQQLQTNTRRHRSTSPQGGRGQLQESPPPQECESHTNVGLLCSFYPCKLQKSAPTFLSLDDCFGLTDAIRTRYCIHLHGPHPNPCRKVVQTQQALEEYDDAGTSLQRTEPCETSAADNSTNHPQFNRRPIDTMPTRHFPSLHNSLPFLGIPPAEGAKWTLQLECLETLILQEGKDGSFVPPHPQGGTNWQTPILQMDQSQELQARQALFEAPQRHLLRTAGLHQEALSQPFCPLHPSWCNPTPAIPQIPTQTDRRSLRSQRRDKNSNDEQNLCGDRTTSSGRHLVCRDVFGFVQRSLSQSIPFSPLTWDRLTNFGINFFFSPYLFPQHFRRSLKNILDAIEVANESIPQSTRAQLTQGIFTPIEILVDEYDPDYRRFNIRLVVNGVTVSFGHLNPRTGVCTFPYAPITALTFNLGAFRRLATNAQLPLHQDLNTLLNWIDSTTLFDWFSDLKNNHQDEWNECLIGSDITGVEAEMHELVKMGGGNAGRRTEQE